MRVAFICILPSPYQRDLLNTLNGFENVDLDVFYLEESTPDSPWPLAQLNRFEHVLRGSCVTVFGRRLGTH